MKKFMALALAMVMALSLVACGGAPASAPASGASSDAAAPAEGDQFKVAIVLGVGGLGDASFNDSMYDGCQMAMAEDSSVSVQIIEPTEVAEFEGHYMELAKSGDYDLIIGSGFDGVEAVQKVSALFPDQKFMFVDGDCGDLPNVTSIVFRDYEKSFLLGYLSAKMSETKKLGYVGGMDIPHINLIAAGYEAGAAYADPASSVEIKYVGGWSDTSTGKELGLALYDGGCDVVMAAAGGSGLGVFTAAAEKGKMAVGTDTNQCLTDPDHVLVSGIRTLNLIIRDGIMSAKAGTLEPGSKSAGLKENGVDIIREGSNIAVPEEIMAEVAQLKADIIEGTLVLPSTQEEFGAFTADLRK